MNPPEENLNKGILDVDQLIFDIQSSVYSYIPVLVFAPEPNLNH